MKRNIIIVTITFFCLAYTTTLAQNQVRIDSLLHALKNKKDTIKVNVLNELSLEYHSFDPDKAIEYGEKALELAQQKKYTKGVAKSLRYIGVGYRQKMDFTHSRKYFFLALPLEEQMGNRMGIAECLNDIGEVYKYRGDYKQALDKYKKAVQIFEELGAKEGTAGALSNIADVYYKLAKYQSAMDFALKSLDIARETGTNEGIKDASLILSEAYASVGNYREAYNFHLLHTSVKDSVFNVEKANEINLMERKFEREKKESFERIRTEREAIAAKKQKQRRNSMQYSLIFIFFIMLFVGIFVMGKFDIPQGYVEGLIFLSLLLVFRFILILLLPYTETYSEGAPIFTLLVNVVLALLFMPLHNVLERKLKKKVIEENADEEKLKINGPKIGTRINKIANKVKENKERNIKMIHQRKEALSNE